MATLDDLHRIAMNLAGTEALDGPSYAVAGRTFTWPWRERQQPKKPKVPRPDKPVVIVESLAIKDALVTGEPAVFFTEPHYNGYKAVLVHLDAIDEGRLGEILADAHAVAIEMGPPKKRTKDREHRT